MADFDLILRGPQVVLEDRVETLDVGIAEGRIAALAANLAGSAAEEFEAAGQHVFPAAIDAHVHFNEPGREHWEGLATGSRAVAAGGGCCFFDMPLNSDPPVLDADTFRTKANVAAAKSVTDFAIWGGLTPVNLDRLEELHECGVIGFKAFMSGSGIDEFPRADRDVLAVGMKTAAKLGTLVAVHAESETMTQRLTAASKAAGQTSIRAYLDSRPIAAELEAIREACELAGETGCELHIVHVSSAEGVALVHQYRAQGVRVTCETCPHYLVLCEDDLLRLGAVAKCAPPVRTASQRDALLAATLAGQVDTVGSDHSPSSLDLKDRDDFFAVWGGIAGAQHLLPLMLDLWSTTENPDWPLLTRLLATNISRRFHLPEDYAAVRIGAQANLTCVRLDQSEDITTERLHYRHRVTPYAGRRLRGRVVQTLMRGRTIARDGQATTSLTGSLILPTKP